MEQNSRQQTEKQIEEMRIQRKLEMTKDISNGICGVLAYEIQKLAEHLISLNYVKLTEDSFVLSKDEYERLKGERKLCDKCGTYFLSAWSSCPKCGTKPNDYERGSKETAEKIICLIKTFCPDKKFIETITRIISERFGVEIKE